MNPERIQLRRTKGWRMPPDTVNVARPGLWGNPYLVGVFGLERALKLYENTVQGYWAAGSLFDDAEPDSLVHKAYTAHCEFRKRHGYACGVGLFALRGQNLACWCKLPAPGQPDQCHAAVLLRLAAEERRTSP